MTTGDDESLTDGGLHCQTYRHGVWTAENMPCLRPAALLFISISPLRITRSVRGWFSWRLQVQGSNAHAMIRTWQIFIDIRQIRLSDGGKSMFSVSVEHVIHPGQGVCTVVGSRDDAPAAHAVAGERSRVTRRTLRDVPGGAGQTACTPAISQRSCGARLLSRLRRAGSATPLRSATARWRRRYFKTAAQVWARRETVRVAKTMLPAHSHEAEAAG